MATSVAVPKLYPTTVSLALTAPLAGARRHQRRQRREPPVKSLLWRCRHFIHYACVPRPPQWKLSIRVSPTLQVGSLNGLCHFFCSLLIRKSSWGQNRVCVIACTALSVFYRRKHYSVMGELVVKVHQRLHHRREKGAGAWAYSLCFSSPYKNIKWQNPVDHKKER